MQVGNLWRLAALSATVLVTLAVAPAALGQGPPEIVVQDGVTQPVFGYTDAIRERLWVTADFDTDLDGVPDEIAMDIIRPAATAQGLESPVIMDASPYFTTLCRGNDSQCIQDVDGDGLNDLWPLFYDNYFVPRGYAVMLLHMVGTGFSTGCPTTGGPTEQRSAVLAIDWLNGRRTAHDAAGNIVTADWHNGKSGMIGKSYDGTLANGAAATGVDGLATIVPISAISTWYYYTRQAGLGLSGWSNNYPGSLSNTVTNPARRPLCAPVRTILNATDGDESFDFTPFWQDRDYFKDIDNVKSSVFIIHGLQDDNVKANHASEWWYALKERDIPRKMWLTRVGHTEPFDSRRTDWVSTIHRWFDHELQGVPNGIMDEPAVTIEREAGNAYEEYADWPVPGADTKRLYFRATPSGAGGLSLSQDANAPTTSFVDLTSQTETTAINNPNTVTNNRRIFLTAPLAAPLKFTGTPKIHLRASVNRVGTSLAAILTDYGAGQHVNRSGEGNSTSSATNCWGLGNAIDTGCFRITSKPIQNVTTQWRVSRGIHDARNRTDLTVGTDLVPGQFYDFEYPLMPEDYRFVSGHQLGVSILMTLSGVTAANTNHGATLTLDLQNSYIELPIAGGYAAAIAAGIPDTVAPDLTVPDDIVVTAEGTSTTVEWDATATDDADPDPVVECDPESGSEFAKGTVTTVTCTATDGAGNVTTKSFTVAVLFDWSGFLATFDDAPALNEAHSNGIQTFWFRLGGDFGLGVLAAAPSSRQIDCDTLEPAGPFSAAATPKWDSFGYQAYTDRYYFPWKTTKALAGTCREFRVELTDGTSHSAYLRFVK
jgi:X-Pro dipeptidyl-peptidase